MRCGAQTLRVPPTCGIRSGSAGALAPASEVAEAARARGGGAPSLDHPDLAHRQPQPAREALRREALRGGPARPHREEKFVVLAAFEREPPPVEAERATGAAEARRDGQPLGVDPAAEPCAEEVREVGR